MVYEDIAGEFIEVGVNVSGTGMVVSSLGPAPELPDRLQKVDVVRPYEVLTHLYYSLHQTVFPVMVLTVLTNVSSQLTQLYFFRKILPETAEKHFPLTRLQSVHQVRNAPHIIRDRKQYQFFIKKVIYPNDFLLVVQTSAVVVSDPLLPLVRLLLIKYQIQ